MNFVNKSLQGFLTAFLSIFLFTQVHAQLPVLSTRDNVAVDANINGYLEILPGGYNPANTTVKYPLFIFIQGLGSSGNGSTASLEGMIGGSPTSPGAGYPHDQVRNNNSWQDTYTVNSTTYKLIVLTPQFVTDFNTRFPTPDEINDFINYAIAHYNVDETRIYLSGNSAGGGVVYNYAGYSSAYANRIAAIIPFSGVSFPEKERADIIRNAHLPVWAFHNGLDTQVPVTFTTSYLDMINYPTAATPEAKSTINPTESAHDSWYFVLRRQSPLTPGLNIYEWMLQYSRPARGANAGEDQNLIQPATSAQLGATWTASGSTASSYSWAKISGPVAGGGSLSATNIANPMVTGLLEGTYTYRVTITPNTGSPSTDDVAITVYPAKLQAESAASTSGTSTTSTTDEGGGTTVTSIDNGDFLVFNVNAPVTGTYMLRVRVAADGFFTTPKFVVKNGSGTVLATVDVYWTLGWEKYTTMSVFIPLTGNASPQALRIESIDPDQFNLNWIQLLAPASVSSTLPVRFTLFNSNCITGGVQLTWKTGWEIDTKDFTIQHSMDGRSWSNAGTVVAEGGANQEQTYTFKDLSTSSLYRIVANDLDGKETYSTIIKAACADRSAIGLFPNPVDRVTQLSVYLDQNSRVTYSVVDARGAVVYKGNRSLPAGNNQLALDLGMLLPGAYTLIAVVNDQPQSVRFIKK